jgi:hypothetical protein
VNGGIPERSFEAAVNLMPPFTGSGCSSFEQRLYSKNLPDEPLQHLGQSGRCILSLNQAAKRWTVDLEPLRTAKVCSICPRIHAL